MTTRQGVNYADDALIGNGADLEPRPEHHPAVVRLCDAHADRDELLAMLGVVA